MNSVKTMIETHSKHNETVRPGLPASFSSASVAGDCIRQGDLYLTIVDKVPDGYAKASKKHAQLVPESGAGSHHRLSTLEGVKMWYPPGFAIDRDTDSLDGPCFVSDDDIVVRHEPGHDKPHGAVTVLAGQMIHCTYQREWAKEEARERRARD